MRKIRWQFWKSNDTKVKQPKMTQLQKVIVHLKLNGSITSWEAITKYDITRLSAIIYKLRHRYELDIDSTLVNTTTKSGEPVRYTIYVLNK